MLMRKQFKEKKKIIIASCPPFVEIGVSWIAKGSLFCHILANLCNVKIVLEMFSVNDFTYWFLLFGKMLTPVIFPIFFINIVNQIPYCLNLCKKYCFLFLSQMVLKKTKRRGWLIIILLGNVLAMVYLTRKLWNGIWIYFIFHKQYLGTSCVWDHRSTYWAITLVSLRLEDSCTVMP